ncbi:MAG TPA: ABC transporter ATP-binding protein [Thermoleophilia bacterium]
MPPVPVRGSTGDASPNPPVDHQRGLPPGAPADSPTYAVRDLQVDLGTNRVLDGVDLEIRRSDFLGILGPNGSGKTTLLRVLSGALKPAAGTVSLFGHPLRYFKPVELARMVGVVPQQFSLDFSFTVEEMVAMGRYAHGTAHAGFRRTAEVGPAGREGPAAAADGEAVAAALEATSLAGLGGRPVTQLSGGERQRALIAQTLAQETPVLLLDEPLNNLDLNHQLEIMQLLGRLHMAGKTIVVVLHDLNIAAQYCQELVLLDHGKVAARGEPADILDPRLILEVFRVRVAVHTQGNRPYITPLWSQPKQAARDARRVRIHVMAGGGAASELLEELVLQGFTPSVGIVSVFDSDYATAQRYELEVVSAPPFQAFPEETVRELESQVAHANLVVVGPVFFGPGNLASLRVAVEAAESGKRVIVMDKPPISERDMSGGEATALVERLLAFGAVVVSKTSEAVQSIVGMDQGGETGRSPAGEPGYSSAPQADSS